MCGILVRFNATEQLGEATFLDRLAFLEPRGPDASWWVRTRVLQAGFTRLAVFASKRELSSINPHGESLLVLLNGEILNYRELAAEFGLDAAPTEYELVRQGYRAHGIDYLRRLDGPFVVVLCDAERRRAFVARDAVGIKPAYFCVDTDGRAITVSSDLKALCGLPGAPAEVNAGYLENRRLFTFSDYHDNLVHGVRQIPPGHLLTVQLEEGSGAVLSSLRPFGPTVRQSPIDHSAPLDRQLHLLEKAVAKRYHHADHHPVGLLLSGGIDSSLLALIAHRLGLEEIVCLFFGPPDSEDLPWARWIADQTRYPFVHVVPDPMELLLGLPRFCTTLSGQDGFLGPYLAERVKRLCPEMKVVLCGEGADELYAGYAVYARAGEHFRALNHRLVEAGLTTRLARKAERLLDTVRRGAAPESVLLDWYLEEQLVHRHLLPLDHSFMGSGLELRLPYLDRDNISFARGLGPSWKLSAWQRKPILKQLLATVFDLTDPDFLDRPKIGLPSAVPGSVLDVESYARAILPTRRATDPACQRLFASAFELLWSDLTRVLINRGWGQRGDPLSVHDLYCDTDMDLLEASSSGA